MTQEAQQDALWSAADAYEAFIGRWSRRVAEEFLPWVDAPARSRWLDVGCGTGALSSVILRLAAPREVVGVDPSPAFLDVARASVRDARARFAPGDARELSKVGDGFDATVSALVLNFVPEPDVAVAGMAAATRPGGVVGAYVWDYADGMQVLRAFWDAAREIDAGAREFDEGELFPLCHPDPLQALFTRAGLTDVTTRAVDVRAVFPSFEDYWGPFLTGPGPAPTYAQSLPAEARERLRERVRASLPVRDDGHIALVARAWAVRGRTREIA